MGIFLFSTILDLKVKDFRNLDAIQSSSLE